MIFLKIENKFYKKYENIKWEFLTAPELWTLQLLSLSKAHLSAIIGVLIGHCTIGKHGVRLGIKSDGSCQSCLKEG